MTSLLLGKALLDQKFEFYEYQAVSTHLDPLFLDVLLGLVLVVEVHRLPVSGRVVVVVRAEEARPGPDLMNPFRP
jgi:hypothetical protein